MATNWPTSRDTFTNPSSGDTLDSPSHAAQHANVNDAVEAMQAHAGLVLVKPTSVTGGTISTYGAVTIGSGVSGVTINGCFSSTFDNYRIVWRVDSATNAAGTDLQLGSATSNYKWAFRAYRWTGATFGTTGSSGTFFYIGACHGSSNAGSGSIDLYGPNLAKATHYNCQNDYAASTDGWTGHGAGIQTDNTQFTDMTIFPDSGTWTGGTIRVYGYNNG